ncbi:AAA family ATPase [Bradyrhizobium sp. WSM 1704]|uniref:AAA family ATPase n=1 Tax=Bradyrhizobium semiaridum TaxID=2821404 RepID=UPI001CE36BB2|nr:AAA family ATPase [Bradyrhizobium semiaridum]MCA6121352.1 AAA family ATPase [Bradyrhizobium semiaridum]
MQCVECGVTSQPGKRFCADCGASLPAALLSEPIQRSATNSGAILPTGRVYRERRHLTVLFGDLVNSTRLAAERDPEDWRDIVTECLGATSTAITDLGGYVARYMGDGVLAYFGWPNASEDAAERAVRAGLMIVSAFASLNRRLMGTTGSELAVRVGIHSGWVVIDKLGTNKVEIFGDTPNVASRVQAKCDPNAVLITSAVHDLVAGQFVVEDYGTHPLPGIARPIRLYRPIAPSGVRRSWRRKGVRGPTPFVNRKREIESLLSSWHSVRNGAAQYVFLTGEPGIGKSRLIEELRSRLTDNYTWMECAGERFSESIPFHAITKLLEQVLDGERSESAETRILQLKRAIRFSGVDPSEMLPLIEEAPGLPLPEDNLASEIGPERARRRLLASLAEWVLNLARRQPLVLVIEDLHWVDPSSIELIGMLVELSVDVPLMLIATARPEYSPPAEWRAADKLMVLERLSHSEIGELIAGSLEANDLAADVLDGVVKRSDGVPLFAEELLSFVVEGEGDPRANDIPATLLDSLTARLDRLGPVRRVAQVAAVLGRTFDYSLLRAVVSGSDHYVQSALEALIEAELIYMQGKPPKATYQFKHALIRDAAYEGLLKTERRELHARVARTLSEQFAALAAVQPALLARHWTEAGEAEAAIEAWKKAGQTALARRAFMEAEESYRQANALLGRLPLSQLRDRVELDLCSGLVRVLQVTKGYSAPETMQLGARARVLAERLGDLPQLIRQGAQTWASIFFTGDYETAATLAEQILEIAVAEGSPNHLFFAHYAQVQARFYAGDLEGVEEHFARLSPMLDTKSIAAASYLIIPIGVASHTAWQQGRIDIARDRMSRAMDLADKSGDPYALAMALHFKGNLNLCLKAPRQAEDDANQLFLLSEKHGLSYASDLARVMLGRATAELGDAAEGVELINQALVGFANAGAKVAITYFLTLLSQAQALAGDTELALRTAESALAANPRELIWRAYTLTWRGELKLRNGQTAGAEDDFRNAIEMSRSLGHKAWQMQAATSLARLLMNRGDYLAARENLLPVRSRVGQGPHATEQRDVDSLLAEIAHLLPAT